MLEIKNVSKKFGENEVLSEVNLAIKKMKKSLLLGKTDREKRHYLR